MAVQHHYEQHNILYILDLVCMGLAVGLIGFCVYIAPFVLFGIENYDIPVFIVEIVHWYQVQYEFGRFLLASIVFLPFLFASVGFIYISRLIAFFIEPMESLTEVVEVETVAEASEKELAEAKPKISFWQRHKPAIIVSSLMLLIIIVLVGLEVFLVFDVFQ